MFLAPVVIEKPVVPPLPGNPCTPSPCGLNSKCDVVAEQAKCTCLANMVGIPPDCRPECVISSDCSSNLACINQRCTDPCRGSCGLNAECRVVNHAPECSCREGFSGNAFAECRPNPIHGKIHDVFADAFGELHSYPTSNMRDFNQTFLYVLS